MRRPRRGRGPSGQTATEYVLVAAILAVVAIAILVVLGKPVGDMIARGAGDDPVGMGDQALDTQPAGYP